MSNGRKGLEGMCNPVQCSTAHAGMQPCTKYAKLHISPCTTPQAGSTEHLNALRHSPQHALCNPAHSSHPLHAPHEDQTVASTVSASAHTCIDEYMRQRSRTADDSPLAGVFSMRNNTACQWGEFSSLNQISFTAKFISHCSLPLACMGMTG